MFQLIKNYLRIEPAARLHQCNLFIQRGETGIGHLVQGLHQFWRKPSKLWVFLQDLPHNVEEKAVRFGVVLDSLQFVQFLDLDGWKLLTLHQVDDFQGDTKNLSQLFAVLKKLDGGHDCIQRLADLPFHGFAVVSNPPQVQAVL